MTIRSTHYTTSEALELIERSRPDTRADWFLLEALRDGLSYWIVNPTSGQRLDGPSQHWYGDDREELCDALRRGYTTINTRSPIQDGRVDLDDMLMGPLNVLGEIRINRPEFDQLLSDSSSEESANAEPPGEGTAQPNSKTLDGGLPGLDSPRSRSKAELRKKVQQWAETMSNIRRAYRTDLDAAKMIAVDEDVVAATILRYIRRWKSGEL